MEAYPRVFQGLGNFGEPYDIKLKPNAQPHCLYTPRRVPLPLRGKVKTELDRMESLGVISKVEAPTLWCAGMVAVPKKSGAIRICVDLKPLNESVLREVHPLPKVDDTLAQLAGATLFTKLDANSGFWQIPLSEQSRPLTTFITPFGRYHFNKLPFGISSAPEHFQRRMSRILEGLEGVVCQMDDILVFGQNETQHDARLAAVLKRINASGATLNPEKCSFRQTQLHFLGHVINKEGVSADPHKTSALTEMQAPQNVTELRRFLGMANQLGKFSPRLAMLSQPLRELLSTKSQWMWGPEQERAFSAIKMELSQPTVLALYDPEKETKLSADSSSYGLGAVLLQKHKSAWKPVAFASRSLSETETRYAQIEKEALAVTWGCEKFVDYILGKRICIETDHKPLVPLLSSKHLDNLPPRILRFRLRLARYDYSISHVPGKLLYTADTLSRAPVTSGTSETAWQAEAEQLLASIIAGLPAGSDRLEAYRRAQSEDPVCAEAVKLCQEGWPSKHHIHSELRPYWEARGNLAVADNLLLYGSRIVIPPSLRKCVLAKIHHGHLGMQKCQLRANTSVWWPGISAQLENWVRNCRECAEHSVPRSEPLLPSPLPLYPWQKVGCDLFQRDKAVYLLVVDYYSRYPEVVKLTSTTSNSVISVLKSIFARHGIPEEVRSDNGPQFDSDEFSKFATSYNFSHHTSSPHYPQSNGLVERAVRTVKKLQKESADPNLALLSYRATPLHWCRLSPAELLMGRMVRTTLPRLQQQFIPNWSYVETFRRQDEELKSKQKAAFDKRHRATPLTNIPEDTAVFVRTGDRQVPGTVVSSAPAPRSYLVNTPTGQVRRNRRDLVPIPEEQSLEQHSEPTTAHRGTRSPILTRSKTGTIVRPPDWFRL